MEDYRGHYKGQHIAAAEEQREVAHGEEADDKLAYGLGLAHFLGCYLKGGKHGRKQLYSGYHYDAGDYAGDDEGDESGAQYFAQPLHVGHIAYGGGYGDEYHRYHHREHRVYEYIAKGSKHARLIAQQRACYTAQYYGAEQYQRETVTLPYGRLFQFHFSSPFIKNR